MNGMQIATVSKLHWEPAAAWKPRLLNSLSHFLLPCLPAAAQRATATAQVYASPVVVTAACSAPPSGSAVGTSSPHYKASSVAGAATAAATTALAATAASWRPPDGQHGSAAMPAEGLAAWQHRSTGECVCSGWVPLSSYQQPSPQHHQQRQAVALTPAACSLPTCTSSSAGRSSSSQEASCSAVMSPQHHDEPGDAAAAWLQGEARGEAAANRAWRNHIARAEQLLLHHYIA